MKPSEYQALRKLRKRRKLTGDEQKQLSSLEHLLRRNEEPREIRIDHHPYLATNIDSGEVVIEGQGIRVFGWRFVAENEDFGFLVTARLAITAEMADEKRITTKQFPLAICHDRHDFETHQFEKLRFCFAVDPDHPATHVWIETDFEEWWYSSSIDEELIRAPEGYNPYEKKRWARVCFTSGHCFDESFRGALAAYHSGIKLSSGGRSRGMQKAGERDHRIEKYRPILQGVIDEYPRGHYNDETDRYKREGFWDRTALGRYNQQCRNGQQIYERTAFEYRKVLIAEGEIQLPNSQ
jgi:hypothetical protein